MEIIMNPTMRRYSLIVGEMEAAYHEYSLKMGFSDSCMQILYTMCLFGDACLLSDITKMLGISKQTINSALRKLETEGVIYLETVENRRKRVCLTEKGKQTVTEKIMPLVEAENSIFDGWTETQREQYIALSQRYLDALRDKIKEIHL